uniref:Uncharacterized protein n=1 Tax=Rhodosorus marinus TaxID=101924 RepID=A0A7S0BQM8_9RHOD
MAVGEVALVTEAVEVEEEDAVVVVEGSVAVEEDEVESELPRDTSPKNLTPSRKIARSHLGMINYIESVLKGCTCSLFLILLELDWETTQLLTI